MLGFIAGLGVPELLLILFVALIIFGPGKLPELGKSLGKGITEFKRATTDTKKEIEESVNEVKAAAGEGATASNSQEKKDN